MESKYSEIRRAGIGLAAVSYDSPAVLADFAARHHIEFPMLSDAGSAIIRKFGILNEQVTPGSPSYGIPYPGIYLLDAHGAIKAKFFEDDYRQRDTAGLILLQQFGIAPPASHTSISAKHLNLSATATELNPRPGQRLALILDIELPSDVHVYAPGVKGYIPIDWQLPDSAALKAGPAAYPTAKTMRLEAIQETVPVYENRFRLTRTITLSNQKDLEPLLDPQGGLTIAGTLRYQACDKTKCFIPETVPVDLTLHLQPLDRTRATKP